VPLARINGKLLFFAHIPKTGGTSVEAYLRAKGALALHGAGEGWSSTPLQHLQRAAYEEILPPGSYDHGFAILRDPVARLVSEFRMRVEPRGARLRPLGWLRVARNFAIGRKTYGARIQRRLEYLDFDAWVDRVFAAFARDPYYRSNHIRPQHEFIAPGHRLFRFEHGLDPVFRWIDAVTETPPVAGAFHERRSAPLDVSMRPETLRRIRAFYAADFALIETIGGNGTCIPNPPVATLADRAPSG
jgi:hypothetical protein